MKTYDLIICDKVTSLDLATIPDDGNIFIYSKNLYDSNGWIIKSLFDDIIELEKRGYIFINTILAPSNICSQDYLNDKIIPIIWCVKSEQYKFNKDRIREKHIWKDVEWGKRTKNYNALGKDPGNVWIPTVDDGRANIIEHIVLSQEDILNRIIKSASNSGDTVLINVDFNVDKNTLTEERNYTVLNCNGNRDKLTGIKDKFQTLLHYDDVNNFTVYFKTSESMNNLKESIDLMVTSPPYWDIKNYLKEGQIGQESYSDYLKRLKKVWKQTYNHLSESGTIWININTIFKNKRVVLIPYDIIQQCLSIGYKFQRIIYWHKSSGIPTNGKNLSDHFEYILVFSKSDEFIINKPDFNFYLNEYFKNSNIWNINRKAGAIGKNYVHPAVFPVEMINTIIKIGTQENSFVLDPFLGSGTSLISAIKTHRNFIGYEFNEDFKSLIEYRLSNETSNPNVNFIFKRQCKNIVKSNKVFRNE